MIISTRGWDISENSPYKKINYLKGKFYDYWWN